MATDRTEETDGEQQKPTKKIDRNRWKTKLNLKFATSHEVTSEMITERALILSSFPKLAQFPSRLLWGFCACDDEVEVERLPILRNSGVATLWPDSHICPVLVRALPRNVRHGWEPRTSRGGAQGCGAKDCLWEPNPPLRPRPANTISNRQKPVLASTGPRYKDR